jgi:hypothetical protein
MRPPERRPLRRLRQTLHNSDDFAKRGCRACLPCLPAGRRAEHAVPLLGFCFLSTLHLGYSNRRICGRSQTAHERNLDAFGFKLIRKFPGALCSLPPTLAILLVVAERAGHSSHGRPRFIECGADNFIRPPINILIESVWRERYASIVGLCKQESLGYRRQGRLVCSGY